MAETEPRIRVLLIDPDEAARTAFRGICEADIEACVHPLRWPASVADAPSGCDVVIVGVDTAVGLQVLADLCSRTGGPPAIGMAAAGFEGKSLEHVLLLAELRGAAATIAGPAEAVEIVLAIRAVIALRQAMAAPERKSA